MRLMISLLIMALILVACGNDATPEPTSAVSSDPTHTPVPDDFDAEDDDNSIIIVTPQDQTSSITVPLPGTLEYDGEFVDEEMGAVFDRVVFTRSGGGDDSPVYLLKLKQDGSYILNHVTEGQVDAETVTRIDNILDEVNFFGITTPMTSSVPNLDKYKYSITVERGGTSMTLHADDGLIPQPVMPLFSALLGVAANADSTSLTAQTVTESP